MAETRDKIGNLGDLQKFANPQFKDGYLTGIAVAADWISQWDRSIASAVNGYRFSDMLLCKFNLSRRKKPRKAV